LIILGEALRKTFPVVRRRREFSYQTSVLPSVRGTGWRATVASSLILSTAIYLSGSLKNSPAVESGIDLERLPRSLAAYTVVDAEWSDAYTDDQAQKKLSRIYSDQSGIPLELFIGSQASSSRGRLQSPNLVFPAGWNYISIHPTTLPIKGAKHEAKLMLTQRGNSRRMTLYWYQSHGETFSGEIYYRFASFKHRIQGEVGDMAVVRIATPILQGGTLDDARERLERFVLFAVPEISKVLAPSG
jgi:EpsI family protein